jgi:hypothetical protein
MKSHNDVIADLFEWVVQPAFREVLHEYKAEINYQQHKDESAVFEAIRIAYEAEADAFAISQKNSGLDVHKQCACLCAAIVKARPLSKCEWLNPSGGEKYRRCFLYPTEMMAFTAAIRLLGRSLIADEGFAASHEKLIIIYENFPFYPGNITDDHGYLSNTLHYMGRFASHIGGAVRLFDTGAYATIFYHLDRENRRHLDDLYNAAVLVPSA